MDRDQIFSVRMHRNNQNYLPQEFLLRICWMCCRPVLRLSPRMFYAFRVWLLRLFGAKIGHSVRIYPSVDIFFPWNIELGDEVTLGDNVKLYSLGKIRIGSGCMVSYGAHFCAGSHDYTEINLPLLKPEICLGQGIWVCAEAYIGPGVEVGDFCIIGARAALHKSFPALKIIGGNPAKILRDRPLPQAGAMPANPGEESPA